jgi:polyisoprenoid-binding protein YceI
MTRFLSILITAFICIFHPLTTMAAEKFTFDNKHSYILFKIKHFDFSSQSGKWYINGEMDLDKDHPDKSKVEASIHIADLVTGIPELDKHLKAKLFFDAQKYPLAKFVSDKVVVTGDKTAKVYGQLSLHGVSKPVELAVSLNKAGVSPVSEKNTVGFTAKTTLKRSDFGMNAYLPGLSDEVEIEIEVEATQAGNNTHA